MKPQHLLISFLTFFILLAGRGGLLAQTVGGALLDTVAYQDLEGADVRLLQINGKDSVSVGRMLSRAGGKFSFQGIPMGRYLLVAGFKEYDTWTGFVELSESHPNVRRLTIYLKPSPSQLDNILVDDDRPVVQRKDTLSYRADKFETRPNAMFGDLLRKLPGVDMSSGLIIAMGDTVKRIMVNGKRFFSNDLTIALKYFPRDVISRIDIFDDRSDKSKFTGVDDGVRIKTINIVTKKGVKLGLLGKVAAGGGSDGNEDLYNGDVSLMHLKGESLMMLVGNANNTSPVQGGQNRTYMGGFNFNTHLGKQTQLYGSVNSNGNNTQSTVLSNTETLLPGDSSQYTNGKNTSSSSSRTEAANINLETDLDTNYHLSVRGNGTASNTSNNNQSNSSSTTGLTTPLNNSVSINNSRNSSENGSLFLLLGRKFAKRGRSLALNANLNVSDGSGSGTTIYNNTYFKPGQPDSVADQNQYYNSPSNTTGGSATLSYTEPLTKRTNLELEYSYTFSHSNTGRTTYLFDSAAHKYSLPDSLLTNLFTNVYNAHKEDVRYSYTRKGLNLTAGMGLEEGNNNSNDLSNHTDLVQKYINLVPMATLSYFSKGDQVNVNYEGRTTQPPLSSLEPLTNNSDPLYVTIGNPHLKQSFSHSLNMTFGWAGKSFSRYYIGLMGGLQNNTVVNKSVINPQNGADTTTYVNLNGDYNLGMNFVYSMTLKHPSSIASLEGNVSDNHSVGYVNGILNGTSNYMIHGGIKWSSNMKHLDLNMDAGPTYNMAIYSAEASQNTRYLTANANLDGVYYTKSGWEFGSECHYSGMNGRPVGYNPTTTVVNLSLAKLFFSHQQGEIKFSVHDLFNQASSVQESISPSMISNTTGRVLGRYYMMTFTYNLKGFGKQVHGPRPGFQNGPPPPPMMPIQLGTMQFH